MIRDIDGNAPKDPHGRPLVIMPGHGSPFLDTPRPGSVCKRDLALMPFHTASQDPVMIVDVFTWGLSMMPLFLKNT